HYTRKVEDGRKRVVAGVSCESCHGGAADWLTMHADYGGISATKATETAAHKKQRGTDAITQGMNKPPKISLIARKCYDCHTVPNETLVNAGGHLACSKDFELVAWSQGIVRHNFVRTGGSSNAAPNPEQLRVMYIVGVVTDLEFSLRGVAT